METELVFDERPPARPDDPTPERLAAFRAKIAACGGLEAAVKTRFPELSFEGVDLSALEAADNLAWRWADWTQAARKLRDQCANCNGATKVWDSPKPAPYDCQRPAVRKDGSVEEGVCEKRERAVRVREARHHLAKSEIPRRFAACTLDGFDTSAHPSLVEAVKTVREFVVGFGEGSWQKQDGLGQRGLVLVGPVGTGKTFLAAAALAMLIERGFIGQYVTVADLLARLRAAIAKENVEAVVAEWRELPIIVLDDLAKEYLPPQAAGGYVSVAWAQEELFRLLDHRYAAERPVIVTSNLNEAALGERYGPAIVSRLKEACRWVKLDVPDHRVKA